MAKEPDELIKGLDEEESRSRSASAARDDLLKHFNERVSSAIRALQSTRIDSAKRVKAASWLGESGDPTAVPALVEAYQHDSDKRVRTAAGYALMQFRALQQAMEGTAKERDRVEANLARIVYDGKLGGRSALQPVMRGVFILLVVLLLVQGGLLVARSTGLLDSLRNPPPEVLPPTPRPEDTNPVLVLDNLNIMAEALSEDAATLLTQYNLIARNRADEGADCSIQFRNPGPAPIAGFLNEGEQPDLLAALQTLNTLEAELRPLRQRFVDACAAQQSIPPDDALRLGDEIIALQGRLNEARAGLAGVVLQPTRTPLPVTATPTVPPTAGPTAEPSPTLEPSPTVDYSPLQRELAQMQSIINQMNSLRGANSILISYWQDVQTSGDSAACREPAPVIPPDYTLPPELVSLASADVQLVIDTLNLGLQQTRASWQAFINACTSRTLLQVFSPELMRVQNARDAYTLADQTIIDILRSLR